ncbi:MAG: magnesium transporter [Chlorobiota bacterium]|jgi:magnesium transporter|nr:magnesium transporter [Chlorobiota bacterium]QQS66287.1 MAG: magnesium transporter [Chlorobiota bacterium]
MLSEREIYIDKEFIDDLESLIYVKDEGSLRLLMFDMREPDIAQITTSLTDEERHYILSLLEDDILGEVVLHLPDEQREDYFSILAPQRISDLVEEMSTDDAADIVSELDDDIAEEVMERLERSDAEVMEDIRDLLQYSEDTAGGRMTTDYVSVHFTETVSKAIENIREFAKVNENQFEVYAVYVVDGNEKLVGVISLQDLVLNKREELISNFMEDQVLSVRTDDDQALVAQLMQKYDLVSIPVVDKNETLLGVVTFDDVADIIEEEGSEDMLLLAGVTDEESLATPPTIAVRRRLPWLAINLGTAFIASLVVSQFENTISKLPILAALMPIVAGMGGNASIQTITVIVRGFALGELNDMRRRDAIIKELQIGLINGLSMGLTAGLVVWILRNDWHVGILISIAMFGNMFVAGVAGAIVPILLKKLKFDPALSSGPIVTTFTDLAGFFIFLGSATLLINWLIP